MSEILLIALGFDLLLSATSCSENVGDSKNIAETTKDTPSSSAATLSDNTTVAEETTLPDYSEITVKVADHLNDIFRPLGRTYVKNGMHKMDFACKRQSISHLCGWRVAAVAFTGG